MIRLIIISLFVTLAPLSAHAQAVAPAPAISPLTGTPLPKTSQWLLYQGGLQSWISSAGNAGLIDPQDQSILTQIADLVKQDNPSQSNQSQVNGLLSAFNMQNSAITQSADYQALSPEWKKAIAPLIQFIQIEEMLLKTSPATSPLAETAGNGVDFESLLQQYIAQIVQHSIGDPAEAINKAAVKIDHATAGESGRGWITALHFRFTQWVQSWTAFLTPNKTVLTTAPPATAAVTANAATAPAVIIPPTAN